MKTLRTFLAERLDGLDVELTDTLVVAVDGAVAATRDWLAQPEIVLLMADAGTVDQAALALRREAVK